MEFVESFGYSNYSKAMIYDTLAISNRLQNVGIPKEQADVQAVLLCEVVSNSNVTKQDVNELGNEIKRDLKEFEHKVDNGLEELEHKLEDLERKMKIDLEGLEHKMKDGFENLERKINEDPRFDKLEHKMKDGFENLERKINEDPRFDKLEQKMDSSLKHEISLFRAEVAKGLAELKNQILLWVLPFMMAQIVTIIVIFMKLYK